MKPQMVLPTETLRLMVHSFKFNLIIVSCWSTRLIAPVLQIPLECFSLLRPVYKNELLHWQREDQQCTDWHTHSHIKHDSDFLAAQPCVSSPTLCSSSIVTSIVWLQLSNQALWSHLIVSISTRHQIVN